MRLEEFDADTVDVRSALSRFARQRRCDTSGLPPGALAYLISEVLKEHDTNLLIVTSDLTSAERMRDDVAFFLNDSATIPFLPTADISPYVEVLQDRQQQMIRLGILSETLQGYHRGLIVPATGLVRRLPPKSALQQSLLSLRVDQTLDREATITKLIEIGYTRAPLAEDPGTFSARGALIDVYTAVSQGAVRIEFDDERVLSLKAYDPESQKAISNITIANVPQARDIPLDQASIERAKKTIREACDEVNLPTTKTLQLLDGLERGAGFVGMHGFKPAFYERLESVLDYVGDQSLVIFDDPLRCVQQIRSELDRGQNDCINRQQRGEPALEIEEHYEGEDELEDTLSKRRILLNHRLLVQGKPTNEYSLDALLSVPTEEEASAMHFGVHDHRDLKLKPGSGLQKIVEQCQTWTEEGMHVLVTTRTRTQLDRVVGIFKDYGVDLSLHKPDNGLLKFEGSPRAQALHGSIVDGFEWPTLGCVLLTEKEIFGRRKHSKKKKRRDTTKSKKFAEGLRQLKVGDYVVHSDHGVARYLGIERKEIAQSAYEKLRGVMQRGVEAIVLEYAGGDKLFVPVTRLGLIRKFSGKEGTSPRLDRLGGSTFAAKKSRVRRAVKQMAEELLKLYAERAAASRPPFDAPGRDYAEFEASFPFEETRDQAHAIEDVLSDLERSIPMDRLVCGDVGFGKTEIAMRAAYRVAMSGKQVAILCPTTVLAQQHFRSFQSRFEGTPVELRVLSRFVSKDVQTKTLTAVKEGKVDIVIGTHRLLSKDVHFADLGLLVVDEEQRFGVTHKERIKKLKANLDVLTLSATPIPRTLQMAVGGIRDLSLIKTAPSDRRAVRTFLCRWDEQLIKDAMERELGRGGQIFYVYNRIEGLVRTSASAATTHAESKNCSRTRTDEGK